MPKKSGPTPTGTCPVCGRTMGLSRGGNMPPHNDTSRKDSAGFYPECPGTRRKPKGE